MTDANPDRDQTGSDESPTLLRQRGVRKRMQCSGQIADRIEDVFVTVEQLVEAIESDQELTEYDGIGPKTAEVIEDWWEQRFEREESMTSSTVERTGAKSASIYLHRSWESALGDDAKPSGA